MTFIHELSARLARRWLGLPLLTLLSLASCDLRPRVGEPVQPGALARVQLSPTDVTLTPTGLADFTAVGLTANGDTVQVGVRWSVTGGELTDTNSSGGRHYGRYRAGAQPGNFRVIATAQSSQTADTSGVIVVQISVAAVDVSPAAAAILVGNTVQLTATPRDANGNPLSGRSVTWSSGNTAVATVSTGGLVTARAQGSTTITATSEGQTATSTLTVTNVPVAALSVNPATASIAVGGTVQLTAIPTDANGNPLSGRFVTWASSDPAVVTVSSSGLASGVAAGSVTITATTEGTSGTAAITVSAASAPVARVEVTPPSDTIQVGTNVQLTVTLSDAAGNILSGRVVTWGSSNAAIASVSGSGLVSGLAVGSATITATSEGQSGSAVISVANIPVASVTVSPASASIAGGGGTVQLTATPRDANDNPLSGRTITWASDNTTVARVSTSGLVTGVVAGLATITATSEGRSGTAAITVANLPVASVTVSPASGSVQVGATLQLTATARDASGNLLSGRAVTWASSNTAAATVSASGRVTGVATGAATITATSEGQNGTSAITVIPVPPPPTAGGIWGIYPNCIAPATPIEMHSWWDEDSLPQAIDDVPRHLHTAACMPNVRDMSSTIVPTIGERVPFVVRVMSYNNPSTISITRWAWESSVEQVVPMNVRCTSAVPTYKLVGGRPECTWYVNMTVDPATALAGIDEIRLTSNIPSHDGLGTRQYTSLNFQLPVEGKTGSYRSTTDPIGRGWYTGLEYANILVGYGDLLRNAGLDRTVPVVSGIVPIRVRSQNLAGDVKMAIYEDMNHHADPTFWKTASVGDVSGPGGGKLLFASNSSYSGTFNWDTRSLPDGRHKLYFQVQETDRRGLNAAALLLLFDVCNSGNC
jgi:uncharacterized protein YjdB